MNFLKILSGLGGVGGLTASGAISPKIGSGLFGLGGLGASGAIDPKLLSILGGAGGAGIGGNNELLSKLFGQAMMNWGG